MSNNDRILERIKKCLALSQSANANEAATALRQAQKLMQKYGLTETDVDNSEVSLERVKHGFSRPPKWAADLSSVAASAFQCICIIDPNSKEFIFVGEKNKSSIVAYAYEVLFRQLILGRDKFKRENEFYLAAKGAGHKRVIARSYCEAWVYSVLEKIREFAEPLTDKDKAGYMDIVQQRDGFRVGKARKQKSSIDTNSVGSAHAVMQGIHDGKSAVLNSPVSGRQQTLIGND